MNSDPDQLLNRFVVAALTVFVTVSLLLAAFVVREIWLQQQIADLSIELQSNLDELKETTEAIQSDLSEIRTTTELTQPVETLDTVSGLLTDVDEQLASIEQEIDQVNTILEPEADAPSEESSNAVRSPEIQDHADQVFTIFIVLTGIAGIAIAFLLNMALRVRDRAAWDESRRLRRQE